MNNINEPKMIDFLAVASVLSFIRERFEDLIETGYMDIVETTMADDSVEIIVWEKKYNLSTKKTVSYHRVYRLTADQLEEWEQHENDFDKTYQVSLTAL